MGFNPCPIEPSDWSDGPADGPDAEECPHCSGTGSIPDEREDFEHTCKECGGSGCVEPPEPDYEPDVSEFI